MHARHRNRLLFWALAIIPMAGFYAIAHAFGSIAFVMYLLFYLFVYRPLIDTRRLISLGRIGKEDAWRFFIPLQVNRLKYIRSLWFD